MGKAGLCQLVRGGVVVTEQAVHPSCGESGQVSAASRAPLQGGDRDLAPSAAASSGIPLVRHGSGSPRPRLRAWSSSLLTVLTPRSFEPQGARPPAGPMWAAVVARRSVVGGDNPLLRGPVGLGVVGPFPSDGGG